MDIASSTFDEATVSTGSASARGALLDDFLWFSETDAVDDVA